MYDSRELIVELCHDLIIRMMQATVEIQNIDRALSGAVSFPPSARGAHSGIPRVVPGRQAPSSYRPVSIGRVLSRTKMSRRFD